MDFTIEGEAGRTYRIRVEEAPYRRADWIQTLLDIDLQTFSEATFSGHAAAALFENGRVFLLCADDIIIGTCVCVRVWDRPDEALMLSMAIRPGWRGRGLGQRFLSGVRDQLASRGFVAVGLLVPSDNRRAVQLYQDVGFRIVAEGAEDLRGKERLLTLRLDLRARPA
jgi:ribosomal protein S18 acetylase RimI-like enzyme